MNKLLDLQKALLLLPLLAVPSACASAQSIPAFQDIKSQAELSKAGAMLDAELFAAVNGCDLKKLASLVDDHIEFFHDTDGLTLGKQSMVDSVRKNICGTDFQRVLVSRYAPRLPDEGLRSARNWRTPVSPFQDARRHGRSQLYPSLAIQRRRLEAHPRHQLRPPRPQITLTPRFRSAEFTSPRYRGSAAPPVQGRLDERPFLLN